MIDKCYREANEAVANLHKEIHELKVENIQLKEKINQYEDNTEDMQLEILEKGVEIKKLQDLLEVKNQQSQLKVNNSGVQSNRNDDLSHFLRIIDSLNQENKQLRQSIELLQYENQKAIQLACNAKNSKLFREINNKLEIQSPLSNSNIENNAIGINVNDTFLNKSKSSFPTQQPNNMNINNLSYIHHNNNSFNNSTSEILKKFNMSDSTSLTTGINSNAVNNSHSILSQSNSANLASTKKNYKYLKPKK